jgi:hypothetical protein
MGSSTGSAALKLLVAIVWGFGSACTSNSGVTRGDEPDFGAIADPPSPEDVYGVSDGREDYENLYLTTVQIRSKLGGCSGVLLASNLVLTAAHCFCPVTRATFDRASCVKEATVRSHLYVYWPGVKGWLPAVETSRGAVAVHDQFTSGRDSRGFVDPDMRGADLAVIFLERPLKGLRPDMRLKSEEVLVGTELTVVGFGPSGYRKLDLGVRRAGRNVVSNIHLLSDMKGRELRFQYPGAHTTGGDSGGPCFYEENGVRWLVGINGGHSNNSTQSWFTSTSSYRDWIDAQLEKAKKQNAP